MTWTAAGMTIAVSLLAGAGAYAAEPGGGERPSAVTVRVYDSAGVGPQDLQHVLLEALGVLLAAGVEATWVDCSSRGAATTGNPTRCQQRVVASELVMRLVTGQAVSLSGVAEMGYSLITRGAGMPSFASIHVDVVRAAARGAGIDVRLLLGRAMAHEIGHLLLDTNAHTEAGLMRALWTRKELLHDEQSDWRFGGDEAAAIRAGLARRR